MEIDLKKHTFDPVGLERWVASAINFFENTPAFKLPPPLVAGSGVYALYYFGSFEHYKRSRNALSSGPVTPIYVGKTAPPGSRQANEKKGSHATLVARLNQHAISIVQAENLDVADFMCRFVIMEGLATDLTLLLESALIRRYKPLWNSIVDGFGNHDPGSGRYAQQVSGWDTLHPGRHWAKKLTGGQRRTQEVFVQEITMVEK